VYSSFGSKGVVAAAVVVVAVAVAVSRFGCTLHNMYTRVIVIKKE
jgi:hypothetical protein